MEIHDHPNGRIITLGRGEAFALEGVRVEVVTTFREPLHGAEANTWSASGPDLATGKHRELFGLRDVGLLPPHVRPYAPGQPLDFGPDLTETGIPIAQAIQRGEQPANLIDHLPRQAAKFARYEDLRGRYEALRGPR
jgi:hypothetical protein